MKEFSEDVGLLREFEDESDDGAGDWAWRRLGMVELGGGGGRKLLLPFIRSELSDAARKEASESSSPNVRWVEGDPAEWYMVDNRTARFVSADEEWCDLLVMSVLNDLCPLSISRTNPLGGS